MLSAASALSSAKGKHLFGTWNGVLRFAQNLLCQLTLAPGWMKIGLRRLVPEFVCHWCREPDSESEAGNLKAPWIVALLLQ